MKRSEGSTPSSFVRSSKLLKRGVSPLEFRYTALEDLVVTSSLNLFVVARKVSGLRPTRGTDFLMTLNVVDASSPDTGLDVMLFGPSEDSFPRIMKGNILRFHRIKIQQYNGTFQGVGKVGVGMKGLGLVVFESELGAPLTPLSSATPHYSIDEESDGKHVTSLREWLGEDPSNVLAGEAIVKYRACISQLASPPNDFFDVVCMVLGVKPTSRMDETVLFVWDGTQLPGFQLEAEYARDRRELANGDILPERADELSTIVIAKGYSYVGMKMRKCEVGHWIKLRNVRCQFIGSADGGDVAIYSGEQSSVSELSPTDPEIASLMASYEERFTELLEHEKRHKVTLIDHPKVPVTHIIDVVNAVEVPRKYRISAKLVDFSPRSVASFTTESEDGSWVYLVQLVLQDDTGTINAYLFGDDAIKFFGGVAPANMSDDDDEAKEALERKMDRLAMHNEPIDFCVKSYTTRKGRKHRIFGTTLLDLEA